MIKKIINQIILSIVTVGIWIASFYYQNPVILNVFYTSLSFTIIYLFYKLILEETLSERIKSTKTRYSFRKVISILYIVTFTIILFQIWIEDTQTLIVTYGLIAAGIAIALQDFFKNFLGGILIFVSNIYTVGDRIEIEKKYGDVIDIGVLTTTLFEIREWVDGEQPTGRLTTVPNKAVVSGSITNYTKDNDFLWDEIKIPLKYSSDWKKSIEMMIDITKKETGHISEKAARDIESLQKKYYLSERDVEPSIYIRLTDNWLELNLRYITDARNRREIHDRLSRRVLEFVQKEEDIELASVTLDITEFPELTINEKKRS